MSIDPNPIVSGMAQRAAQSTVEPSTREVETFASAMAAQAAKPEQALFAGVQQAGRSGVALSQAIAGVAEPDGEGLVAPTAQSLLWVEDASQKQLRDLTVVSKVLGSAAAGINKLTSMS